MANLDVAGVQIPLDADGYLAGLEDWSETVAEAFAAQAGIVLNATHWEVITLLREFYCDHQLVPSMRPLVKLAARRLGEDKGNSIYLLRLFPGNPALVASRIAGLPRPENCF